MSNAPLTWDDKEFMRALRKYCDLRGTLDLKKELRRRAKNVGMKLVKLYKEKGVTLSAITQKVRALEKGKTVRIRPTIRAKGRAKKSSYKEMVTAELNARRSAKGFTSTGWFPAVEKLGGTPKRAIRGNGGPRRGKLVEKVGAGELSETLINQQPGAAHVLDKNKALIQQALDEETADMVVYIVKKLDESRRKNGL